jgi:hypothetical protein
MAHNSTDALMSKHILNTGRLIEVFSGRAKLMPGDTFAIEYIPGQGSTFYIVGQPQGAPVGDEEFIDMVLNIWVGKIPADEHLKAKLLANEPN